MHCLATMPEDSIHAVILRDNIADAQEHPSYGDWAGGIVKQYSRLGMASLLPSSDIIGLNSQLISLLPDGHVISRMCSAWHRTMRLGLVQHPV